MNAVESSPLAGAAWPGSARYRRWAMDRFPFILVYEIRSEAIEFVAIAGLAVIAAALTAASFRVFKRAAVT